MGSWQGGGSRLDNGTGSVVVNADGSISLAPAAAKNTTVLSGALLVPAGSVSAPGLGLGGVPSGLYVDNNHLQVTSFGAHVVSLGSASGSFVGLPLGAPLGWHGSTGPISYQTALDLYLWRDAANILAQRNGANAQASRLYNTFTDASNYERLDLAWESNVLVFRVAAAGTGTQRGNIQFEAQANGQRFGLQTLTELTTIAAAAQTDTAIQIPANAVVLAVSVRVVTVIPTASTFTVKGTTSATLFSTAGVGVAAGSTDMGTASCPYKNGAAQTIRITPDLTPAAATGQVRVTIHYYQITPPTS